MKLFMLSAGRGRRKMPIDRKRPRNTLCRVTFIGIANGRCSTRSVTQADKRTWKYYGNSSKIARGTL